MFYRFLLVGLFVLLALHEFRSYVNLFADLELKHVWKTNLDQSFYSHVNSFNETHTNLKDSSNQSQYIQKGNPVSHIAFLKIHKAASTTVGNIFLRYGYENHLVFAVPRGHGGGGPSLTPRYFLPPPRNKRYDIFCAHARYNREEFNRVLPNDATYIGIVREPFSQFRSLIRYFRPKSVLDIPGKNPVLEYLSHNEKYMKFGGPIDITYNKMAYEFGFPEELFWNNDQNRIQSYLRKLSKEMDIVLVVEYLDESIVLMRRLLNWDLRHALYGKLHVNKRNDSRLQFGSKVEKLYKSWAHLDYALYGFFLRKLKKNLKRQLPDFYDELAYFRRTRIKIDEFCSSTSSDYHTDTEMSFGGSKWNKPFVITKNNCENYT
ncbi:Galactose-3-O-sulfotransferase 3 [Mizuhopecten yessoensis]|uniref:Galactose-3-O-sulfotransferase 3 n=1 Tax=Mizuhopecten yessoensis TaxID=6573 RepID=A0A210QNR8_MIZYE|nr:Galactose-3-O-sulfotransferase 3 [Mizuhopecten yessoensis]